jgi:hypothetical protein
MRQTRCHAAVDVNVPNKLSQAMQTVVDSIGWCLNKLSLQETNSVQAGTETTPKLRACKAPYP